MFDVKTRFRFSSEGGVGEKTRFGGGRFVIGTPSLPLHKPFLSLPYHTNLFYLSHYTNLFYLFLITQTFFISSLLHKPFLSLSHYTNLFYLFLITQTFFISHTTYALQHHFHSSHKHYLTHLFQLNTKK